MALSHGGVIQDKLLCVAAVSWNHQLSPKTLGPQNRAALKMHIKNFHSAGKEGLFGFLQGMSFVFMTLPYALVSVLWTQEEE